MGDKLIPDHALYVKHTIIFGSMLAVRYYDPFQRKWVMKSLGRIVWLKPKAPTKKARAYIPRSPYANYHPPPKEWLMLKHGRKRKHKRK